MPIKIPKGFPRRKSSGNALEELQNLPNGSFRVLESPSRGGRSFDGGYALRKPADQEPHRWSRENAAETDLQFTKSTIQPVGPQGLDSSQHEKDDIAVNRGSGVTDISFNGPGPYGSGASSMRLSTASNSVSSLENCNERPIATVKKHDFDEIPTPPPILARPEPLLKPLRNYLSSNSLPNPNLPEPPQRVSRSSKPRADLELVEKERNVSTGTASTATPPDLFDSPIGAKQPDLDDFSYLFDNFALRDGHSPSPNRLTPGHPGSGNLTYTSPVPPATQGIVRKPAPASVNLTQSQHVESSPYSWTSQDSRDQLLRTPSPLKAGVTGSPLGFTLRKAPGTSNNTHTPMPENHTPLVGSDGKPEPLRLSPVKRTAPPSSFPEHLSQQETTAKDSPLERLSFDIDPAIAESAELASKWEEFKPAPPNPSRPGKVMTPAQFERYRAEREREQRLKGEESGSDEDRDRYQDDDEIERDRQATKQRRKQEAQLAVYRQSMMKVTGERPLSTQRSISGMSKPESHLSMNSRNSVPHSKSSGDEEEDEDVPLGVLAAHGFPNKNRPPARLSISPSPSHLGAANHAASAAAAGSVREGSGSPGPLPPFARNLPKDPYVGAGLVNPSNRESLAMGGGSSIAGVPAGTSPGTYAPHPSGLVGIIAEEERSRAMRRGSAAAPGTYDAPVPGLPRSQTLGNLPYPGAYPGMMPGMLTPGEHAQYQMSHQMNQMMQLQWQWMQQMQYQMAQLQGTQQSVPDTMSHQRPHSTPIPEGSGGMGSWNGSSPGLPSLMVNGVAPPGAGYTPSIAPSERSNVGLASRYRPVSVNLEAGGGASHDPTKRSSTFTASTARPWSSYGMGLQMANTGRRSPTGATIRTVNPAAGRKKPHVSPDDEEDEEGWAEMKKARDKKKKSWALKRGTRREREREMDELRDLVPDGL